MADSPYLQRRKKEKTQHTDKVRFLSSVEVRARYGNRSPMWLWRIQRSDASFPRPAQIGGRLFWAVKELDEYDRQKLIERGDAA